MISGITFHKNNFLGYFRSRTNNYTTIQTAVQVIRSIHIHQSKSLRHSNVDVEVEQKSSDLINFQNLDSRTLRIVLEILKSISNGSKDSPSHLKDEPLGVDQKNNSLTNAKTQMEKKETFLNAISKGDVATVESMLTSIDLSDSLGTEALESAINRSPELVDILIANGANVARLKLDYHGTALWQRACQNGSVLLVKELLKNKMMTLDVSGYGATTPIIIASKQVNIPLVELFLSHGEKATPNLVYCMYMKNSGLLRNDAENLNFVTTLIQYGLNPNGKLTSNFSLLHLTIEKEDIGMIKLLIEKGSGIDVECNGVSPLYYALAKAVINKMEIIKFLIESGTNPKKLTENEIEVLKEYLTNAEEDEIMQLLMNHNPEVREVVKQDAIQKLQRKMDELSFEVSKMKNRE